MPELAYVNGPFGPIIEDGLRRSAFEDAVIYVQLTRGVAPRVHAPPEGLTPTVVMTFKPLPVLPAELRERGARVMTVVDTRWSNCYIKATTLLPNVLAKGEALRRGYDDAIFVAETGSPATFRTGQARPESAAADSRNVKGEVRECTASNIFVAKAERLRIPPRTEAVLHGVTQGFLIECATAIGLSVEESAFNVETLYTADEVFMSGTTVEALGITSIDDRPVADGKVGPITRRLYEEFTKRVRRHD